MDSAAERSRERLHLTQSTTQAQVGVLRDPARITQWDTLLEPEARRVGIGAAQGNRPGEVENAVALFVYTAFP